jgi:hypothetical protein
VVAGELLGFSRLLARASLEPAGEALVELCARLLRDRFVGSLADEHVPKSKNVFPGEVRPLGADQALAREGEQVAARARAHVVRAEVGDGAPLEDLARDRGQFDHRTLFGGETVEASGEKGLDRRGHPQLAAVLCREGDHLLDEERVALGDLDDPVALAFGQLRLSEKVGDQHLRRALRERFQHQHHRARLGRGPRRPLLQKLRTSEADEEHRRVARPLREILDQVEKARLGPVDILEDEHEGALPREGLEEPPDRPEGFLDPPARLGEADGCLDSKGDRVHVGLSPQRAPEFELTHDLGERPEGDPFAVGQAASDQHGRRFFHGRAKLGAQARLADPGRAEHGDKPADPFLRGALECFFELRELALAPDERSVEFVREGRPIRKDFHQAPSVDRLRLPLESEGPNHLDPDSLPKEAPGRVPYQYLARTGSLLEAGRHVDGVPGRERLPLRGIPSDDLARIDTGADRDLDTPVTLELFVQVGEPPTHLGCRTHRPQSIVFVQLRDAEDGHDRVPDELLDRPAVLLEHRARLGKVTLHDSPDRLRVEPLAQTRRTAHIGEHDRNDFARCHRSSVRRDRGGAYPADSRPMRCSQTKTAARLRMISPHRSAAPSVCGGTCVMLVRPATFCRPNGCIEQRRVRGGPGHCGRNRVRSSNAPPTVSFHSRRSSISKNTKQKTLRLQVCHGASRTRTGDLLGAI